MKSFRRILAVLVAAAIGAPACAANATAYIAVAANFSRPMQALTRQFERATGYVVRSSAASTGTLYAQIMHGAPYDAFLSADAARPRRLEDNGRAVAGSRFTYAVGELVLWAPRRDSVDAQTLARDGFDHLAIANPQTAPYGAAAEQTLRALGLWHKLVSRIVRGESINQAYQFVVSGNAQLGFVARSQLPPAADGARWPVPQKFYAPLAQQAVLLQHGRDDPAARAFLAYLKNAARPLIARFGYRLPGSVQ